MSLAKYKNPVKYSFMVWIRSIKENYEPVGQDYFLDFVKNTVRYHASKWQNLSEFKSRVKKELPKIDDAFLDEKWGIFEVCLDLQKAHVYPNTLHSTDDTVPKGNFLEYTYKNGEFKEEFKPLPKI